MKRWLIGVLVLAAAYFVASPFLTVHYMKSAAERRDGEALSEYVDFPAVREDLKDQINLKLGREMTKEMDDNPFAALGGMLAGAMIGKMVDVIVTPAGLIELMKGDVPDLAGGKDGRHDQQPQEQSQVFQYLYLLVAKLHLAQPELAEQTKPDDDE